MISEAIPFSAGSVRTKDCFNNSELSSQAKLRSTGVNELHDLICVGFGPASLAIAIALSDELGACKKGSWDPKVCFLERQPEFAWHAGMQLPDAKMQISFIKDLATLRNPRSEFTFLNYLKKHDRLVQFSNLGTFLPSRLEFEDYMRWCSRSFEDVVEYSHEVLSINPTFMGSDDKKSSSLTVAVRNVITGERELRVAKNVVIAVGGTPAIPAMFSGNLPCVLHSSAYASTITRLLPVREHSYHVAVVGGGQSAAEVYLDLHSSFPNAKTTLIIRDSALRPSDDSPFVNEIFNPEAVDSFYEQPKAAREKTLASNKSTNYSVIRPELLERIYSSLYQQSIKQPDQKLWKHQILPTRCIVDVRQNPENQKIDLTLETADSLRPYKSGEIVAVDAVVLATGYVRNAHLDMLKDCQQINGGSDGQWHVGRDYQVELNRKAVADGVGIWLQGCNESSHGLSDSLLSILATRSGELVRSIFKYRFEKQDV